MIHTSRQLKALVRNKSGGDNAKAMVFIRNYIMERFLERISLSQYAMKTPLKVDISTNDVITPGEINYEYRLMFEERSISVLAYNLETVLAEKMETIISRGALNTRMRDFYDLMVLSEMKANEINYTDLKEALTATSRKRGSYNLVMDADNIFKQIKFDRGLAERWSIYQRKYEYAVDYDWKNVMKNIELLYTQTFYGVTMETRG